MVISVLTAGYIIHLSCDLAKLSIRLRTPEVEWTRGLIVLIKNTNSLNTTGSRLIQAKGQEQVFKAV